MGGVTTWFRMTAGSDGVVRIRDNFGGREVRWGRPDVKKAGLDFALTLRRGETVEATIAPAPVAPSGVSSASVSQDERGRSAGKREEIADIQQARILR
jgi:hypothetical protein